MSEPKKDKINEKRPYTAPKLVEYGSVSKLTEAKSNRCNRQQHHDPA